MSRVEGKGTHWEARWEKPIPGIQVRDSSGLDQVRGHAGGRSGQIWDIS